MAALHLAFDIDPDVYPELHAMLSAIGSDAARGERFRQLAATGLVWETVRVRGYPVSVALAVLEDEARAQEAMAAQATAEGSEPGESSIEAGDPATAGAGLAAGLASEPAAPVPFAEEPFSDPPPGGALDDFERAEPAPPEDPAHHAHPKPMTLQDAEAALPEFAPRDDGFVDLAIDAQPEPPLGTAAAHDAPAKADDPDSFERAVQQAAREVPVLRDVVDPLDVPLPLRSVAPAPDRAAPPVAAKAPARGRSKPRGTPPVTLIAPSPAPAAEAWRDTPQAPNAAAPGDLAAQAPVALAAEPRAPRSRLLRMKEKGLFKNG